MAPSPLRHSVIIPTLGRPEALNRCIDSLNAQTQVPEEIILVTERGELAQLRNQGARKATGEIISFIDDDVVCSTFWSESIRSQFNFRSHVVGVSGIAYIPEGLQRKRDLFRYRFIKYLYDLLFLEGKSHLPGRFTQAGTWTTGAVSQECDYEGQVDFLEACNQTWRKEAFWAVGGFDESYGGIGDWSEPDLAFRVRAEKLGTLWFTKEALVAHECSQTGAYLSRQRTGERLSNYYLFSSRWIKPHWKHTLFKLFINGYYGIKELKWRLSQLTTKS